MPYVQRNQSGAIVGVYALLQPFATEFIAPGDPRLVIPTLAPYAYAKQSVIMSGGITVNVGGTVGNVEASTDTNSLVILNGAYTMAQANPGLTFNWVQSTGVAVTLTSAQVITIFNAVSAFIQSTFTALSTAVSGISGGTITTTAQVDAVAWPVNS